MSIEDKNLTRREFIIVGAASVAAAGFATTALASVVRMGSDEILSDGVAHTLYADESRGFLLILTHTYDEATDTLSDLNLSWRDYFEWTGDLTAGERIPLSTFRSLKDDFRVEPRQLDDPLSDELLVEVWKRHFGPEAQAYRLLDGLGFNGDGVIIQTDGRRPEIRESGILFFCDDRDGKVVYCQDEYSVYGLRDALNELGVRIDIEIV